MNYYRRSEVSNSDLTALMRVYYGKDDISEELEGVYAFGSLVDAMLTEPLKVRTIDMTLTEDDGNVIQFSYDDFVQATIMANRARKDPIIAAIIKHMAGQYIFVRTLRFQYEGEDLALRCRCKFDQFSKAMKMGADYKTTSCTSLKQFREAIPHFHWDRQAAFYMDLARIDRHWIIGISKKTGEVFKHVIERGDLLHTAGVAKYSFWAYRWKLFIEPFNVDTIKLAA